MFHTERLFNNYQTQNLALGLFLKHLPCQQIQLASQIQVFTRTCSGQIIPYLLTNKQIFPLAASCPLEENFRRHFQSQEKYCFTN